MKPERIDCKTCGGRAKVSRKHSRDGHEMIASCHRMFYVEVFDHKPTMIEAMHFLIKAANIPKDALTTNDHHPQTPAQIEEDARVESLRATVVDA